MGVLFGRVIVRGPAPRASQGSCGISGVSARSYVIYAFLRVFAVFNFNTLREWGSFFGGSFLRGSLEVPFEGIIILRGAGHCEKFACNNCNALNISGRACVFGFLSYARVGDCGVPGNVCVSRWRRSSLTL